MRHIQIYRLRTKRRAVARELRAEQRSRQPDARRLSELWKRKLMLSDQLARLEA